MGDKLLPSGSKKSGTSQPSSAKTSLLVGPSFGISLTRLDHKFPSLGLVIKDKEKLVSFSKNEDVRLVKKQGSVCSKEDNPLIHKKNKGKKKGVAVEMSSEWSASQGSSLDGEEEVAPFLKQKFQEGADVPEDFHLLFQVETQTQSENDFVEEEKTKRGRK